MTSLDQKIAAALAEDAAYKTAIADWENCRARISELEKHIAKLERTLAQPHMEWAAGQFSVGGDIEAEDRRLRDRVAELEAKLLEARESWKDAP